jgi:eukaryotic-like serine/threonine-protein kinase
MEKAGTLEEALSGILSERAGGGSGDPVPALPVIDERRFAIAGERARGGIGLVFEATDRLLGRRLALKQPQPQEGAVDHARFLREVLITARLQHPAIVPIYDVGVRATGEPCYSMRLVPGATLRDAIAAAPGLDERLALLPHVQAVADAVAYAHEQAIVHRDLKPGNVLVGPFGETVVIDWGLAKDLRGDPAEAGGEAAAGAGAAPLARDAGGGETLTRTGAVLGTPGYMPPEQARGEEVDERADVYAIGAVLYHLLTGAPPQHHGGDSTAPFGAGAGGHRPRPLEVLEPGVPPDLAAIVAKAMSGEPAARYPSAGALAHDLKRFATGQLVGARRYSAWTLAWRWLRRHRATALVGAALIVAVIAGVVAVVNERDQTAHERNRAQAENNRLRLMQAQAVLDRDPTAAIAWLKTHRLEPGAESLAVAVAARARAAGVARHVLTLPGETPLKVCLAGSGRQAAVLGRDGGMWLFDLDGRGGQRKLGALAGTPVGCLFSARDQHLVSWAARAGGLVAVKLPDGAPAKLGVAGDGPWPVRLAANGSLVVSGADGMVRVVPLDGRPARALDNMPANVEHAVPAPAEPVLYGADFQGGLWRIPLDGSKATLLERMKTGIYRIAVSGDGRRLAFGSRQEVGVRDLTTGQTRWRQVAPFPGQPINVSLGLGGGVIFLAGDDSSMKWWEPGGGEPVTLGRNAFFKALGVTDDGARAAWTDTAGTVYVADLAGRAVRTIVGHQTTIRGFALTPDGRWLATTHGAAVRIFALPAARAQRIELQVRPPRLRAAPGRGEVVAVVGGQTLVAFDAASARRRPLLELDQKIEGLAVSPGGRRAVVAGGGGRVVTVDLDAAAPAAHELARGSGATTNLVFADDDTLVGADERGGVNVWDIAGGRHRVVTTVESPAAGSVHGGMYGVMHGAITAARGRRRALVAVGRAASVIDLDPDRVTPLDTMQSTLFRAALSRDGRVVVAGSGDGRVILYEGESLRPRLLARREGFVSGIAFTADERSALVADETGVLSRIELASGEATELGRHGARISQAHLSPSRRLVATLDTAGEVRVWEPATGGLAVLRAPAEGFVVQLVDESHLAAVSLDGSMQLFTLDADSLVPAAPAALSRWLEAITTARITERGEPLSALAAPVRH